ncbi:MAG: glycosyl hydrolase family 18 protein [Flammeovirgaceae bacterium]
MKKISTNLIGKVFTLLLSLLCLSIPPSYAQVNTGGTATTANHQKEIIGYITNWDAWKNSNAGLPAQGALTQLNIDYSKYTILNYSFFGVAVDGSLHSGDHRNKNIYKPTEVQAPADIFFTDIYSSWDLYLLFGELETINYINEDVKQRAEAQGFQVEVGGSTWTHPVWGLSGSLPLPLKKEGGAGGVFDLAKQNNVKVMASIGGWSMCKHFPEMAADPVKRAKFIEDCQTLIASGFDGIDLDWEYPGPYAGMNFTGTQADFANYTTLVAELRNAIGPDKLITAAFSAAPSRIQGFEWSALVNTMDYFNFMTYDFNGGWSNIAGHNSPLYPYTGAEADFSWERTYQALVALNVPMSKCNFGLGFYGRGVETTGNAALNAPTKKRTEFVQPDGNITTASDFTNWPKDVYDGTPNYFFIKQKALGANSGWTKHWDDEAKVPYLTNGKFFLSYDDEQSIGLKSQYVVDKQMAGVLVWTVYGDLEFGGTVTNFGTKLKRWSSVQSPLINKVNEVFANGSSGNQKPSVSLTGPVNTDFILGESVAITANATDADGTISKVEFYAGTTKLGEDTVAPYEYNWTNASAGSHTLTAKATDNQSASTVSAAITITVTDTSSQPNVPPTVSLTSPNDGDSFESGATITLTADANDSDGTISKVAFYQGTTKLGEATGSPYSITWNAPDGNYAITAKATDDDGASTTSNTAAITVTTNSDGCAGIPAWTATGTYLTDDIVQHEGKKYRAKWWTQGQNPASNSGQWAVWEYLEDCGNTGGGGNQSPTVNLTNPTNGASIELGASFTVSANASDTDGSINTVEFFAGSAKIGEASATPYSISWSPAQAGAYSLTAKATDNEGASTTSSIVNVSVTNPDTGGDCGGLPQYSQGSSYGQDEVVQNEGNQYQCNIPGWCSSNAGWAYAPGTGAHWQDAWSLIGSCGSTGGGGLNQAPSVAITSPNNGSTFIEGQSITLSADANDSDGSITKVEFYQGSTKLGEDTNAPYSYTLSNAAIGSYTFTAVATDDSLASTTSDAVSVNVQAQGNGGNGDLPARLLVGYWHNFDNGSSTPTLRQVSSKWDVINVSFAEPTVLFGATMAFSPDPAIYPNPQDFIDDVAFLQAQGKKVLISIGGANGKININNSADAQAYSSSMINIINTYGFDGLDIDLEGGSLSLSAGDTDFTNTTSPKVKYFIEGMRTVLNAYGSDFILTAAPETAYVQGGFSTYSGLFGAYLPVLYEFRNELTYIHVQHYNSGCMLGLDGRCYSQGTPDFHVAMAEMLLTGFPVAGHSMNFPALRQDQVLIGLPSAPPAAGGGFTSVADVHKALDYLIKGISYGGTYQLQQAGGYPNFRGIMTWSINWDIANNFEFSNSHRAYLDALGATARFQTQEDALQRRESKFWFSDQSLHFNLDTDTQAQLSIHNALGQRIVLIDEPLKAGKQTVSLDKHQLSKGFYVAVLVANGKREAIKLILD